MDLVSRTEAREGEGRVITSITGTLTRVMEDEVRVLVGAVERQVLVPDLVRRQVQLKLGSEVTLRTLEYLEGNPQRGRLTPRLVGFLSEPELEFFELICTVDGIGVRTALKAMVRPVRDVADMIQRQDVSQLATLPGVSASTAERVIAKLRKKVTRFALMVDREAPMESGAAPSVIEDAFQALLAVGHGESEARGMIERALKSGKKFKTAEDVLQEIYQQK